MPPTTQTDPGFVFRPLPPLDEQVAIPFGAPTPLGPLDPLAGTWTGTGFNTIWRPHFPSNQSDRFLELNLTNETLAFTPISGAIPNRGLLQADMSMFGLTYMQQISDASNGAGLHIEPGIWAVVPETTNPQEPPTVVRMASIPHGTVILAQGMAVPVNGGPQISDNNIIPFAFGQPPPPNTDFGTAAQTFTEMNLQTASAFRTDPLTGITQNMVTNPNSVLKAAIAGQAITSTAALIVSTTPTPVPGGGTANTDYLQAGNANATQMSAIFWIETVTNPPGPDFLQLQYTQTVMLDFNGLHWPHVTVATLRKNIPIYLPTPPPVVHPD
jgi:hypothetical protein